VAADETTLQHLDYGLTDAYMLSAQAQLLASIAAQIKNTTKKYFNLLFSLYIWEIMGYLK